MIIPSDQISHLNVYGSDLSIYGDMYKGDPTELTRNLSKFLMILAKPKSAILIEPFFIRRLAGLRSLCTMLFFYNSRNPYIIYLRKKIISFSCNFCLFYKN